MKKQASKIGKFILALAIVGAVSGCGKNRAGIYMGTETVTQSYGAQAGATQPGQAVSVTITVRENGGDQISGTWQSQTTTGNFTATGSGDSLTNFQLTPTNTYATQGCSNIWIGTLTLVNNRLTGTLSLQGTTAQPAQNGQPTYQQCPTGTRTVDAAFTGGR